MEAGLCPSELASIAFGRSPFKGYAGLYSATTLGKQINPPVGKVFNLTTVLLGDQRIVAGIFPISGIDLMMWLPEEYPPDASRGSSDFTDWGELSFSHRPVNFNFNVRQSALSKSHSIKFSWT